MRSGLRLVVSLCCLPLGGGLASAESLKLVTSNSQLVTPTFECTKILKDAVDDLGVIGAIGTFLLPQTINACINDFEDAIVQNAERIGRHFVDRYPEADVIVFNEVFDDDAKDALIEILGPHYPHRVEKIANDLDEDSLGLLLKAWGFQADVSAELSGAPNLTGALARLAQPADSGLMLFSRYPFEPLPEPVHKWSGLDAVLDATSDEIAFLEYGEGAGVDKLADKGVGLVRVRPAWAQQPFTVVFTHAQAGSDQEDVRARKAQLADVRRLIEESLGDGAAAREKVIVVGDLNINGVDGILPESLAAQIENAEGRTALTEWTSYFSTGALGEFFRRVLVDSWALTTSPHDRGLSTLDGKRLDYVIVTNALEPGQPDYHERLCVQHLTVRPVPRTDHHAVAADILEGWHARCSPNEAFEVQLRPSLNVITVPDGEVGPDEVQWYHVSMPLPGTVSILATASEADPEIQLQVYARNDLTNELGSYHEQFDPDLGLKYAVPSDFYVKVSADTTSASLRYTLRLTLHDCSSPSLSCVLHPSETRQFVLFGGSPMEGGDRFFDVWVNKATSGAAQTVRLRAASLSGESLPAGISLRLFDKAAGPDPLQHPARLTDEQFSGVEQEQIVIRGRQLEQADWLLVLHRDDPSATGKLSVEWETNLTVFSGVHNGQALGRETLLLVCEDETNGVPVFGEVGEDEIRMEVAVDGGSFNPAYSTDINCDGHGFEARRTLDEDVEPVLFVESLAVRLVELDDSSDADYSPPHAVQPLPLTEPGPEPTNPSAGPPWVNFARERGTWEFEGGEYWLGYNLAHRLNN